VLKSEVFQGQGMAILEKAGATPLDYQVVAGLDSVLANWRAERAKKR
jgi:hypothetical protein